MRNILFGLTLLLALTTWSARAGAAETRVLTTVDDATRSNTTEDKLLITGIVSGDSAPTTLWLRFEGGNNATANATLAGSCERYALMMMSRPGRYVLELTALSFASGNNFTSMYQGSCKLKRAP
jgi:hypothetical protein